MSSFGRGLDFLKDQQDKLGGGESSFSRDRMYKLWLKNGEQAKFWFIQDFNEVAVPLVHMVTKRKRNGGGIYNADIVCGRYSLQESVDKCSLCQKQAEQWAMGDAVPEVDKIRGPWPRYVAIVWVDVIVHPIREEGKNWKPVNVAGSSGTVYMEEVKDYRLFIMRDKVTNQIGDYLSGDPMSNEPKPDTVLDRAWKFKVQGERQNKVEILTPDSSPSVPEAVADARKHAPNIDSVIVAEFGESPRSSTVASGNGISRNSKKEEIVEYEMDEVATGGFDEDGEIDF